MKEQADPNLSTSIKVVDKEALTNAAGIAESYESTRKSSGNKSLISATPKPAIATQNLTQTFGAIRALNNITLTIPAGKVTALLGPNGAGKSTLIDLATGLTKPKSGNIKVFGLDPLRAVRSGRIGVSQQSGTFPEILTIKSALQLLAAAWPKHLPIEQLMELCDLNKIAKRKIKKCSGGEVQRFKLALALLPNPDLLILDEATTGMDVNARVDFWQIMHHLAQQERTIVFATHYLAEAEDFAHNIAILDHGQLAASDSPDKIRSLARSHLSALLAESSHTGAQRALAKVQGARNWNIWFDNERIHIDGADLDDALRTLAQFDEAADFSLTRASLDEAFTHITQEANR